MKNCEAGRSEVLPDVNCGRRVESGSFDDVGFSRSFPIFIC